MMKDFFYFSKRERQGIIVLLVLLVGIFFGKWFFSVPAAEPLVETQEVVDASGKAVGGYVPLPQYSNSDRGLRVKPAMTSSAGAARSVASSAEAARAKTSSAPASRTFYARDRDTVVRPASRGALPAVEKLAAGETLELNVADTLLLKKIPGVGSSFAKRIVAYRTILGGYHRVEQLQEVYGMYVELYEQIAPYIQVDEASVTRLSVNKASLDKLRNHPYLNFYQAKAIIETRKKRGTLQGIEDLQLLDEFTADDWGRITPYLDFR
ncbi:hypothetical protein SAMD00024442_13_8 [Candidatus Symbiothrix dinenymphae]|nr:hypothetical protein SAMD00024442_13_8 [Candidatus Symbiothrix dinenymphae]